MFQIDKSDYADKSAFYERLQQQAEALVSGEPDALANVSNIASLLYHCLPDVNWAGIYVLRDNMLVLGPFQGLPACVRIPLKRGVCGTAAAEGRVVRVADVDEFPGHIACDSASRSEIVLPLYAEGKVIGVLDIDSPEPNRFDEEDEKGLTRLADYLNSVIDFKHL
ncbi:GAF domain-containing protein [Spongorhabdus nitratireducens]